MRVRYGRQQRMQTHRDGSIGEIKCTRVGEGRATPVIRSQLLCELRCR